MLDIIIITIGRVREQAWQIAADEYLKRIRPYAKINLIELKAEPFQANNQEKTKQIEGQRIMKALEKYSDRTCYLLAEQGQSFDSIELANWFNRQPALVLVIAGALGFSQELFNRYPQLSLSVLTFPHELARVILLEQIYRSSTILNNKKYHY